MKKYLTIITSLAALITIAIAATPTHENLPSFPKYSENLLKPLGSCSCSGAFSSCSQSCSVNLNCTCTCGAFTCSCTACSGGNQINEDTEQIYDDNLIVSISSSQYKNWEKLTEILISFKSKEGNDAYLLMLKMLKTLTDQKFLEYRNNAQTFEKALLSFSGDQKKRIDDLLFPLGSRLHSH